jgi:hypothetical protein
MLIACDTPPRHADFEVGMSRQLVRERFGEPLRSQVMHKRDDAIWGPIEDFWSEVPLGATVEIWTYRTSHETVAGSDRLEPGTTELYFVDGALEVSGMGFAPEGAVYEAGPGPTSE